MKSTQCETLHLIKNPFILSLGCVCNECNVYLKNKRNSRLNITAQHLGTGAI